MTSAEEDYLKAIYHLVGSDNLRVSTNAIANQMGMKPASVTDMIKKLAKKGFIFHRMYKGVRLTEQGHIIAVSLLRKQRLWEVFLVQKLHFSMNNVHDIAQSLQHIHHEELIDKLDTYLGFPQIAPSGEAIPTRDGTFKAQIRKLLVKLPVGASGIFVAVKDDSPAFLKFLDKNRIHIGASIQISDKEEFDGSFGIQIDSRDIRISEQIATNLYLEIAEDNK